MIGLALGHTELLFDGGQKIVIKNIIDVQYCTGLTKLAYMVIFNLLSKYNAESGIGCGFSNLVTNLLSIASDLTNAILRINDEIEMLKNRLIIAQSNSPQIIPDNEKLEDIIIEEINFDEITRTVIINVRIINILGQSVYIRKEFD